MKDYWDKRFELEEEIWGKNSSQSSHYALKLLHKRDLKRILIPGAGYGRNSIVFSNMGYKVVGVEISDYACILARKFDPKTKFINASVLNFPLLEGYFDGIFCFNILHLFLKKERIKFLENCYNQLKNKGLSFFTLFSEKESSFGKGDKIEENTFESKPGRPTHYFSKKDLLTHFKNFSVIKTGIINEQENHGGRAHIHKLRYILAEKN